MSQRRGINGRYADHWFWHCEPCRTQAPSRVAPTRDRPFSPEAPDEPTEMRFKEPDPINPPRPPRKLRPSDAGPTRGSGPGVPNPGHGSPYRR